MFPRPKSIKSVYFFKCTTAQQTAVHTGNEMSIPHQVIAMCLKGSKIAACTPTKKKKKKPQIVHTNQLFSSTRLSYLTWITLPEIPMDTNLHMEILPYQVSQSPEMTGLPPPYLGASSCYRQPHRVPELPASWRTSRGKLCLGSLKNAEPHPSRYMLHVWQDRVQRDHRHCKRAEDCRQRARG